MNDVTSFLPALGGGLLTTIRISVLAFLCAMVVGTVAAIFRISRIRPLEIAGLLYVEIIRNGPLLLLLFLLVFGLPDIGILLPLEIAVVVGLGLYSGTYVCEVIRSGVNGLDVGVIEAARASGLTMRHVLRDVILPLSVRTMIPPLATVFISTVLGSALAAAIGVDELTGATRTFNLLTAQPFVAFALAAVGYLAINIPIGLLSMRGERKWRYM